MVGLPPSTIEPIPLQTHDYQQFSGQYAELKLEGSYFLAFNAVAEWCQRHPSRGKLLDFGCGTGRSTRFLRNLGFDPVGVDINPSMLAKARQAAEGEYYLLDSEQLPFPNHRFDAIFQSFVLLEYSSIPQMINTFEEFHRVLTDEGIVIVVTGSEEYYRHNWSSFEIGPVDDTCLASGCKVRVGIRDTNIVLFDYYWTDNDYRQVFQQSGFEVIEAMQPLAQGHEPFAWVNECEFPCWTIYVLKKQ